MVLVFWLGGILLLYLVLQIIYSGYYFFRGRNLAKASYSRVTTLGSESDPNFKLFMSGDSVAAGVGASSFETSVAGRLAEYFSRDKKVEFENVGVSGYKIADVVNQKGPTNQPDLIILVVSSNNYFRLTSLSDFQKDVVKLFEKYSRLGNQVVLIGPGRVADSSSIPLFLKPIYLLQGPKYSTILKSEASKYQNVIYANPLENPIETNKYGPTLASDHFHPNDEGHRYWFDLILKSLKL